MASIAGEIYRIARKKGFTGPDTYDIDKAVGAVTEGITGTPSPTYGTITDALSDLYTVVSGGGGGGVTLGNGQYLGCTNTEPVVGQMINYNLTPTAALLIDGQFVTAVQLGVESAGSIAAGVTADVVNSDGATACHVYSCTEDEGGKVATLTPVTTTTSQVGWSFVIPDGGEGGLVVVWLTYP